MRTIGIEFEANTINTTTAKDALSGAGIRVRGLPWTRPDQRRYNAGQWSVTSDSSLACGSSETVSPPLSDDDFLHVRTVCNALRAAGGSIRGTDAGTHVHVDANDFGARELKRICILWTAAEKMVHLLVAPSRRDTYYCRPNYTAKTIAQVTNELAPATTKREIIRAAMGSTRYKAMNLHAFRAHGTIEFRIHQGTLNSTKILSFARLMRAIVDAAKSDRALPTARFTTVQDMVNFFMLSRADHSASAICDGVMVRRPKAGTKVAAMWTLFDRFAEQSMTRDSIYYAMTEIHGYQRNIVRGRYSEYLRAHQAATTTPADLNDETDAANYLIANRFDENNTARRISGTRG